MRGFLSRYKNTPKLLRRGFFAAWLRCFPRASLPPCRTIVIDLSNVGDCKHLPSAVVSVLDIIVHIFKHTLRRVCTCARVCAVCSFALGDEGGGVQLCRALVAGVEHYFDTRKDTGLSVFFLFFDGGGSVRGCMCLYTHTHIHTARGVLRCEPRGRDETLGGYEESRWTKSRHICICMCVQSTYVYMYADHERRDEILN